MYEAIEALRIEAGSAGDMEMVRICNKALAGDEAAWAEAVRVINEAAAQN